MHTEDKCLEELELQAIDVFGRELQGPIRLADRAFGIISLCSANVPVAPIDQVPESRRVCLGLLVRLANDVRAVRLLANYGYAVQAMSLLASAMEAGYTVAFIGRDEERAKKWVQHADTARACWPRKQLIEGGLQQLKWLQEGEIGEIQNCVYMHACMAKHANPVLQRLHGYECESGAVRFTSGPALGEPSKGVALQAAWFALLNAVNSVIVALASFVECHLSHNQQSPFFVEELASLMAESLRLAGEGRSRWHE